jgi:Protein of unknown function (DUF3501)
VRKVDRSEVLAIPDYLKVRDEFRASVFRQKEVRRIHLGGYLTFLFENHDTVLYQIQEMMRAEGIAGEEEIRHEMETYNELLGEVGVLGATLLVEIDAATERDRLLRQWRNLPEFLYLVTADGARVSASFDPRQVGDDRISSVQYLKFCVGDRVVSKIACAHPELTAEADLTPPQVAALSADLIGA